MNPHNESIERHLSRFKIHYPFVPEEDAKKIIEELEPYRQLAREATRVSERDVSPSARQVRALLEHARGRVREELVEESIEQSRDGYLRCLVSPRVSWSFNGGVTPSRIERPTPPVQPARHSPPQGNGSFRVDENVVFDPLPLIVSFFESEGGTNGSRFDQAFTGWFLPELHITHLETGTVKSLSDYCEEGFVTPPTQDPSELIQVMPDSMRDEIMEKVTNGVDLTEAIKEVFRELNGTHRALSYAVAARLDSDEGLDEPTGLEASAIQPHKLFAYGERTNRLDDPAFQREVLGCIISTQTERIKMAAQMTESQDLSDATFLEMCRFFYAREVRVYGVLLKKRDDLELVARTDLMCRFSKFARAQLELHHEWFEGMCRAED